MADSAQQQAVQVLHNTFGLKHFYPLQEQVIHALLDGRNALAIMPTGGGKSLCYQVPAMVRAGMGVVLSPLIALMKDQVDALRQFGVQAEFLNSSLSRADYARVQRRLRDGTLDLLYIAPERLLTDATLEQLCETPLALFAIDEAHCVSRWGHDFRPEYAQLSVLAERFADVPRLALTATADAVTRRDIIRQLALDEAECFVASLDRPNIRYLIHQQPASRRQALLQFITDSHRGESGIVYCLSRQRVEDTAQWLSDRGLTAIPYHAGMGRADREAAQNRFSQEDGVIVVATIAFGMGIDKPDVRFVAHLNLPKNIEAYYQETGRAGRDGAPASAWMSYGLSDVVMLMQMLQESRAEEGFKRTERQKTNALLGLCESVGCRRETLFGYFGEAYSGPCANCDNCLSPPETWDGTVAAQKALSCVYRTGQRFGAAHLIDVLLARDSEKIRRLGHHRLSVYGAGSELGKPDWSSVLRQLTARGLLAPDPGGHGGLRLTPQSRPVLKGEESVSLRRLPPRPSRRRRRTGTSAATAQAVGSLDADEARLYEQLRTLRATLAREQNVPVYVIFGNATLLDMVRKRPRTALDLMEIAGVGEVKLARYGAAFLRLLESS